REHGALALLIANGPRHHAGEPLRKPKSTGAGYMTSGLLAAFVSDEVAAALLKPARLTLKTLQDSIDARGRPHSVALPETVGVTTTLRRRRAHIANVVGWIRGRDTTR